MRILVFDTETTGKADFKLEPTHPLQPWLAQLGALLADDGTGKEYAKISTLIKPNGWEIEKEAESVHGITTADCEQFGIPDVVVLALFNSLVKQADRIVCHNAQFDVLIMRALCHRLKRPDRTTDRELFCTMKAYTPICKIPSTYKNARDPYKWPTLQEAYVFKFKKEFKDAHDALSDVMPTWALYRKLTEKQKQLKGAFL